MNKLKYDKTTQSFDDVFRATKAFSDLGDMTLSQGLEHARNEMNVSHDAGRKWAFVDPHYGETVLISGKNGYIHFTRERGLQISRNYTQTQIYIYDRNMVVELLEYSFYTGNPVFGLIEALDLQIDEPLEARTRVAYWLSVHKQLVKLQEGT